MPTGGISAEREDLEAWFSAGAVCVGMGTQLIPENLVEQGDYEGIAARIRSVVDLISDIRS